MLAQKRVGEIMSDMTYAEYLRKDAAEKNMNMQEYNLWREQRAMALRGQEILRKQEFDKQCVELYQEWVEKSPEKLSVGYKKESTDES